jgi:hypothetical protein
VDEQQTNVVYVFQSCCFSLRASVARLRRWLYLSDIPQSELNAIARRQNERPRQTLGFETPAERFGRCVASIG